MARALEECVLPCARWEGLVRLLRWKVICTVVVMGNYQRTKRWCLDRLISPTETGQQRPRINKFLRFMHRLRIMRGCLRA